MIIGDRKKVASIIVSHLNPEKEQHEMMETPEMEKEEHEPMDELHVIAREALDAIKADDEKGLAEALHSFFELCDSMPHSEGEHLEESEELAE